MIVKQLCTLALVITLTMTLPGCQSEEDANHPGERSPEAATPTTSTNTGSTSIPVKAENKVAANVAHEAPFSFIPPQLTEEELRDGWISLFDGVGLFGWSVPDSANWHVEDNCIVADEGEVSLLRTPFAFGDFEFRCDFHLAEGGNSGVFLRTAADGSNPAKQTYELNICDTHKSHKTGSLVARHVAENVPAVEGSWHTFHVVCDGNNIKVKLDDQQIVDFTDETENARAAGQICLQMNNGRIAFRNVFLKPLHPKELFNGTDLTGWRAVPGGVTEFTVADGLLHAENGRGYLETEEVFDDFILHVEANIHDAAAIADGRPANSGVFFRAMPGTEKAQSNGYEMQIQHDFKDGDRTQALDFGSGGIYRRQPARYIVADNNEWFVETLIAQGNRFATFVNGYQVLDWIDDRDADDNPRKGQRLAAGHISLQGHDPTTNLDFRSLRIHVLDK